MKKSIKTIGTIATIGIMLVSSYMLGTTQAETITVSQELQTVTKIKEIIPDSYIDIDMDAAVFHDNYVDMREVVDFEVSDDGLQLYLEDGSGYYWER